MKKRLSILLFSICLIAACAVPGQGGPSVGHGLSTAATGFAHLILSPLQIAAGLLEGIAAVPYYVSTDIHALNRGLIDARAKITLDDTYNNAYGKQLNQVPASGDTGTVFRRMKDATQFFQSVLRQYGLRDSNRYFLTSIDTANDQGYTLFAVIYRPVDSIQVVDKYDNTPRVLSVADRLFYEPFQSDVRGSSLDKVIDWAGLPRNTVETQKGQAVLITIAANSVLNNKQSNDYWEVEKRWMRGEFRQIAEQRTNYVKNRMGI